MTIVIISNEDATVDCRQSSIALLLCLLCLGVIRLVPVERYADLLMRVNSLTTSSSAIVYRPANTILSNPNQPTQIQIPIDW